MVINIKAFESLQSRTLSDKELAKKMNISRTQIWRAKKGKEVGTRFISAFKKAFPEAKFEDYFFYS